MVWVTIQPTYYCETRFTRWPTFIAYDDGTVLTSVRIGAGCEQLPDVRAGHVDVPAVLAMLDGYFATDNSHTPLDQVDGLYDAPYRVLTWESSAGRRSVRAYALGSEDNEPSIPDAQRPARAALLALLESLNDEVQGSRSWVPDRIVVVRHDLREEPSGPVDSDVDVDWPLPASSARAVLDPHRPPDGDQCLGIAGADARKVLAANRSRTAKAWWTMTAPTKPGDTTHRDLLRLGYVVPGWLPCRTP